MAFTEHQILLFFLILVRITSLFVSAPIFSYRGVPYKFKVGAAGLISLLIFPVVDSYPVNLELTHISILLIIFKEIFTGVIIGFGMGLLFAGIQLAGEYISMDMGFSMAQIFDPNFFQQVSVITRVKSILAILLFLILDGHHFLLEAVAYSYRLVPIGSWELSNLAVDKIVRMSAQMFVLGVKISSPALVALFLTSVTMGVIARTVPQMNIFFVGFPLRIFVGLVFLALGLPLFVYVFRNLLNVFQQDIIYLLQVV